MSVKSTGNPRQQRIDDLIDGCMQRCAAGESLDEQALIKAHPDLMPELGERLQAMRLVLEAGRRGSDADQTVSAEIPHSASPRIEHLRNAIDGYEIVRAIHSGGQGAVYQAIQKSTKRKVAIKLLLAGAHASKSAIKRFEREVELVAQLQHPHIIAVFESGTTREDLPFFVMDYVRGTPLDRYVREKSLSLEETLTLVSTICAAVQYAHQKGVIHRDLKPSNMLVDADRQPKILDFGLAKLLAAPVHTVVSMTQEVLGTLPYMSPEQVGGNPDAVDTRTDIYSLGVILYELLTGQYPYPVGGPMTEVLQHIAETPPTPPSRSWSRDSGVVRCSSRMLRTRHCPIDNELETVVLKTLSKQRERRYQSAGELARDLNNYLAGVAIEAKRDSTWYVFKTKLRRHKTGVALTAVILIFLCMSGVYAYRYKITQRADGLVDQGKTLERVHQRRAEAYAKYTEALRLDPDNYLALCYAANWKQDEYFRQAFTYRQPDLLAEANRHCDRALAIHDDRFRVWNLKCMILYSLGHIQEAEESCRRALALNPDYQFTETNLAIVLALQKRMEEATAHAERGAALCLAQSARGENDDFVWRTLGTLQLQASSAEALASFETARTIDHSDVRNWLLIARGHLTLPGQQSKEKALEASKHAYRYAEARDPRFTRILAQAYLENGQYEDAALHAQAAIENGDLPAYGHAIQAIAEKCLGNHETARKHHAFAVEHRADGFNGQDVLVTAEKGLLWFDNRAELDRLIKHGADKTASVDDGQRKQ